MQSSEELMRRSTTAAVRSFGVRASRGVIQGKGGAAEILDINPSTLRSRMEKLGQETGLKRCCAFET